MTVLYTTSSSCLISLAFISLGSLGITSASWMLLAGCCWLFSDLLCVSAPDTLCWCGLSLSHLLGKVTRLFFLWCVMWNRGKWINSYFSVCPLFWKLNLLKLLFLITEGSFLLAETLWAASLELFCFYWKREQEVGPFFFNILCVNLFPTMFVLW